MNNDIDYEDNIMHLFKNSLNTKYEKKNFVYVNLLLIQLKKNLI